MLNVEAPRCDHYDDVRQKDLFICAEKKEVDKVPELGCCPPPSGPCLVGIEDSPTHPAGRRLQNPMGLVPKLPISSLAMTTIQAGSALKAKGRVPGQSSLLCGQCAPCLSGQVQARIAAPIRSSGCGHRGTFARQNAGQSTCQKARFKTSRAAPAGMDGT
jgi:hypothetical protein